MMQITDEEYVILRGFFHETSDYRINHDMKKADNLENLKSEVIRLDAMYGHENIKVVKTIEYTVDVTISDNNKQE